MSRTTIEWPSETTPVLCQGCDWSGKVCETLPIENFEMRVQAGELVPFGECPECGALCHALPTTQMNAEQVKALLSSAVDAAGSQSALAVKIGIPRQHLSDIRLGRRAPSDKVLEYLGLVRVVYRVIKPR